MTCLTPSEFKAHRGVVTVFANPRRDFQQRKSQQPAASTSTQPHDQLKASPLTIIITIREQKTSVHPSPLLSPFSTVPRVSLSLRTQKCPFVRSCSFFISCNRRFCSLWCDNWGSQPRLGLECNKRSMREPFIFIGKKGGTSRNLPSPYGRQVRNPFDRGRH